MMAVMLSQRVWPAAYGGIHTLCSQKMGIRQTGSIENEKLDSVRMDIALQMALAEV
jgi:hypothetical protein